MLVCQNARIREGWQRTEAEDERDKGPGWAVATYEKILCPFLNCRQTTDTLFSRSGWVVKLHGMHRDFIFH